MQSSTNCSETRKPHTDGALPHPPALFGVVVFAAVAFLLGRGFLPPQESPVFSLEKPGKIRILLGSGFSNPGVHQFSDGITAGSVMELTGVDGALPKVASSVDADAILIDGMALSFGNSSDVASEIERDWMPARQRLALGIPLHPDRMSREDWIALPGIGEKLALQIEQDRQNYGDFGSFEALERVKGIGPGKLKKLRPFFIDQDNYP